jgi:uncharacterized SAM-binding protein YcdF (DUF218 family)
MNFSLPYTVSKLLISLVSPVGATLAGCVIGLLLIAFAPSPRFRRAGMVVAWLSVLWLWAWSLPFTGDVTRRSVESEYPAESMDSIPKADVIVLLGGALSPPVRGGPPYPNMAAAADRVWHAARLYHAKKAPLILASGGSDSNLSTESEAEAMRTLLVDFGVPASAIILEARSRTTKQNAQFSAEILRARKLQSVLLVTSALHMRRALNDFEATGVQAIPVAADHSQPTGFGVERWFPSAGALDVSGQAMKEVAASWVQAWRRGQVAP